jgi:hypothetical protein
VLREVKTLERLHHPHVISYKHAWLEATKTADFGPQVRAAGRPCDRSAPRDAHARARRCRSRASSFWFGRAALSVANATI